MKRAVFSDPSGRRWRRVKVGILAATLIIGVGLSLAYVNVHTLPDPTVSISRHLENTSPIDASAVKNPVLVGSGFLVRILKVKDGVGYDPFTKARIRALTPAENKQLHGSQWVVDNYGYPAGRDHLIALTFDDGPSPKWTPKILAELAKAHVPATFFLIGENAKAYPEIVAQEVSAGNAIGNHSYTHPDLNSLSSAAQTKQLMLTDRILRSSGHVASNFYRPPYTSLGTDLIKYQLTEILRGQRLGYILANYDYDVPDWVAAEQHEPASSIPLPTFDGQNLTVVMHDAGGQTRQQSVDYLPRLIAAAKAHGYTFYRLSDLEPDLTNVYAPPSLWDRMTPSQATIKSIFSGLFFFAILCLALGSLLHVALAIWRRRRHKPREFVDFEGMPATVAIAAYNEDKVIGATLDSVSSSLYQHLEILVVDDGSTDNTAEVVRRKAKLDPRIRLIQQANGGKSTALNNALRQARGEVIATFDADGVVDPDTVPNLVRPFIGHPELGATSGAISVGNANNFLTRWQRLEYIVQVGVDRAAHEVMGSIMVVPGAAGAWRREAVLAVGGYSTDTLGEDADLCLTLQHAGYRVEQVDDAYCYTEAPENFPDLMKQRKRWLLGQLQCLWKHRGMMFRRKYGLLGMFNLPFTAIGMIVPFIALPFVWIQMITSIHTDGFVILLPFFLLFGVVQVVVAATGVILMKAKPTAMIGLTFDLLAYPLMRAFLLYRCAYMAVSGRLMGWNKMKRTGSVSIPETEPAYASNAAYAND